MKKIISIALTCIIVTGTGFVSESFATKKKQDSARSPETYARAFAYCRKKYGTSLESVEFTKRFGQTGYFCLTRG